MKVAVILINYKDYADRYLPDCADSLRNVEFADGEFKVFVVDNSTSEESQNKIKEIYPECELIPEETNSGFGGGLNLRGLRSAEGLTLPESVGGR